MSKVETILAEREADYGDAGQNFEKIGKVWGALLEIDDIPAYQVALMMDALKTVRLMRNPEHEDSWLDKEGYTAHGKDIASR
jgi:hypothetical protein